MRIEFSAKAWMLSVATGLACVPTLEAEAWPTAAETKAVITAHAEEAATPKKATSKRPGSFLSRIFNRTEPAVTKAKPYDPLEVSVTVGPASAPNKKVAQTGQVKHVSAGNSTNSTAKGSVKTAAHSTNSEPGRLSAQATTGDAISQSKPARQNFLSRLFSSKTKSQPAAGQTAAKAARTKKTFGKQITKKTPASRPKRTVASSPPKSQASSKPTDGKSEVQRQLEEMYRRNGRQMPSFLDGANKVADPSPRKKAPSAPVKSTVEVADAKSNSAPPITQPQAQQKTQQVAAKGETNKASQISTTTSEGAEAKKDSTIRQVAGPLSRFFGRLRGSRNPNDERPKHVERMSPADRAAQQRLHQGQTPEREYLPRNPEPIAPIGIIPPAPAAAVEPVAPVLNKPEIKKPPTLISETPDAIPAKAVPELAPAEAVPEVAPAEAVPELAPPNPEVAQPNPELASPKLPEFSPAVELPKESAPKLTDAPAVAPTEVPADSPDAPIAAPAAAGQDPFEDALNKAFPEVSETEADAPAPMPADAPFTELKPQEEPQAEAAEVPEATVAPEVAPDEAPLLPEPKEFSGAADAKPASDQLPEIKAAEKPAPKDEHEDKLNKIAERTELMGLKGFCPVVLRDERDLRDASPMFNSEFEGQKYNFSSDEARKKFEANPAAYAPAAGGRDVVLSSDEKNDAEGTLGNAVWFKDRLYLFSSKDTLEMFVISPAKYSIQDSKE